MEITYSLFLRSNCLTAILLVWLGSCEKCLHIYIGILTCVVIIQPYYRGFMGLGYLPCLEEDTILHQHPGCVTFMIFQLLFCHVF